MLCQLWWSNAQRAPQPKWVYSLMEVYISKKIRENFSHENTGNFHSHLLSFTLLPISIPTLESYSHSHWESHFHSHLYSQPLWKLADVALKFEHSVCLSFRFPRRALLSSWPIWPCTPTLYVGWSEVTESRSRYDRHFMGVTWHNAWN